MDMQVVRWITDLLMGMVFLVSFCTGLLKFTILFRELGLTFVVFPLAGISDIHDWAGILLGCLVLFHLFLNRRWIAAMTKKMIVGEKGSPSSS